MKVRTIACLVLALLLAGAVAFAGVPPKTELSASGAILHPKEGPVEWQLGGELLAPLGSGHVLLGPSLQIHSDSDLTEAGAVLEFNLAGKKLGPFFGAEASYLVKDPDVGDRESIAARAGVKAPIGESGLMKIYAERTVQGRGKDAVDYAAILGLGVRF